MFHGTGGDENQFFGLAEQLLPEATIVSPRGDVSEYGAARFFRRTGEGVYDMEDLLAPPIRWPVSSPGLWLNTSHPK